MKYGHMSEDDILKALGATGQTIQDEARFILQVADGKFKLPVDPVVRDQLIEAHGRTLLKLRQDYQDLMAALSAKQSA